MVKNKYLCLIFSNNYLYTLVLLERNQDQLNRLIWLNYATNTSSHKGSCFFLSEGNTWAGAV